MDQAVLHTRNIQEKPTPITFFIINFASVRTKGLPLPILYQISVVWEEQACYASSLSQDCSAYKYKTLLLHYLETQQLYRVHEHVLCKLQW